MYFHTGHFAFTVTSFLLTYHSLLHNTETPTSSSSPAVKSLSDGAALCLRGLLASPEKHLAAIVDCSGTRILDCGVEAQGTAELGVIMADVAMGGRGKTELNSNSSSLSLPDIWPECPWPLVQVHSNDPVSACLASQYAGWQIDHENFKAMASGPIRAAIGKEKLFETIGRREQPETTVGLLETNRLPPETVCHELASLTGLPTHAITLLVAATKSPAGMVQVIARSLETALHQLHERGFDLERIVRGTGTAPLPPERQGSLNAIGCANDAILYGSVVRLDVVGDDDSLEAIGPHAVSSYSNLHGESFSDLFKQANQDFYALDPGLFAPAILKLRNLDSGRHHQFGFISPEIVEKSFLATG